MKTVDVTDQVGPVLRCTRQVIAHVRLLHPAAWAISKVPSSPLSPDQPPVMGLSTRVQKVGSSGQTPGEGLGPSMATAQLLCLSELPASSVNRVASLHELL